MEAIQRLISPARDGKSPSSPPKSPSASGFVSLAEKESAAFKLIGPSELGLDRAAACATGASGSDGKQRGGPENREGGG